MIFKRNLMTEKTNGRSRPNRGLWGDFELEYMKFEYSIQEHMSENVIFNQCSLMNKAI